MSDSKHNSDHDNDDDDDVTNKEAHERDEDDNENGQPAKKAKILVGPITLCIDIGGTGIKLMVVDVNGVAGTRFRKLTPKPATPIAISNVIRELVNNLREAGEPEFVRCSVGFPGLIKNGAVHFCPNLDATCLNWQVEYSIAEITKVPTRVANDADIQGHGVIKGSGVEMLITLGTGVGAALFTDGHLVPNLELGHHPWHNGKTYEERLCKAEQKRIGKKSWGKRVREAVNTLSHAFNYDILYIGGGNSKKLEPESFPENVVIVPNVNGLLGGVALWRDD